MLLTVPTPIREAIRLLGERVAIVAKLSSAEWAERELALREEGFFSAGVDWAEFLDRGKAGLLDAIALRKEKVAHGEAYVDRSSWIGDMRKLVLARGKGTGEDPSDLTDLASRARLGLIFDMQTRSKQGQTRWKFEQDPDVLNAFPAQELLPSTARVPRTDWDEVWDAKGGPRPPDAGGRLVALKTDPIWERINRFGVPWPPFDYGSQRDLADVDRAEAERLGLIEPGRELEPAEAEFTQRLEASAAGLSPETKAKLQGMFGDQITFEGDRARWRGAEASR